MSKTEQKTTKFWMSTKKNKLSTLKLSYPHTFCKLVDNFLVFCFTNNKFCVSILIV